jgi:hypothetical protein
MSVFVVISQDDHSLGYDGLHGVAANHESFDMVVRVTNVRRREGQ